MSSHHDEHNHSNEPKKVQFRTPLIMGFVSVLLIFLAVSTCDPKHGCCEDSKEKCESKCEKGTTEHGGHEAAAEAPVTEAIVDTLATHAAADTTVKSVETHEAPAHDAHAH